MGGAIIDEIASKQPERTLDSSIRIEFFHQHDQQNAAQPPPPGKHYRVASAKSSAASGLRTTSINLRSR